MEKREVKNLISVKQALADKYVRLAAVRQSKIGRAKLLRQAEVYRRQVKNLQLRWQMS